MRSEMRDPSLSWADQCAVPLPQPSPAQHSRCPAREQTAVRINENKLDWPVPLLLSFYLGSRAEDLHTSVVPDQGYYQSHFLTRKLKIRALMIYSHCLGTPI